MRDVLSHHEIIIINFNKIKWSLTLAASEKRYGKNVAKPLQIMFTTTLPDV